MDAVLGFYGKLPTHGDFLRRGLPDTFVGPWDRWLQSRLGESRSLLGPKWVDAYLASPVWRFVLGSGLAGAEVWAGILIPSVDRVGRQFPFCAAAGLSGQASVFRVAALSHDWFEAMEQTAFSVLHSGESDLEVLIQSIQSEAVRLPPALRVTRPHTDSWAPIGGDGGWRFEMPGGTAIDLGLVDALERLAMGRFERLSLWWTDGSKWVTPQWRCEEGWPAVDVFTEMLGSANALSAGEDEFEGAATEDTVLRAIPMGAPHNQIAVTEAPGTVDSRKAGISAAAWSDTGKVREANQDAYLLEIDKGLWAVADGMGGQAHGELASRMVVNALEQLTAGEGLEDAAAQVVLALHQVNSELRRYAHESQGGFEAGSTAVVLTVRESRAAIVWIGDSRLYRLRKRHFECLTRDHSAKAEVLEDKGQSILDLLAAPTGELTRAVGGADTLECEIVYFGLEPGDGLLLCSDGLYTEIAAAGLSAALGAPTPEQAVRLLAAQVEASEARDNVTAVVVNVG